MFTILFFSNNLHLMNLHSFPTRRSSDLDKHVPVIEAVHDSPRRRAALSFKMPGSTSSLNPTCLAASIHLRSEEHTSELQSPDHLVFRLLLEKIQRTPMQSISTHSSNNTS